jgi:hypothetical protein
MTGGQIVHHDNLVPLREQLRCDDTADVAGAAGHQNTHKADSIGRPIACFRAHKSRVLCPLTSKREQIADDARKKGAEHHWFADDGSGNLMIVDIWDTREHFEEFFSSEPAIKKLMAQAGIQAQPSTVSYEVMDTPDMF